MPRVNVLCIARHPYIAQHLARFFARVGVLTEYAVGLQDGAKQAHECHPDAVICEYDLLATLPLGPWEQDEPLSHLPIIAVSLTRRPGEGHLLDVNNIAGFLYLPALSDEHAHQVLEAATRGIVRAPAITPLSWTAGGHSAAQRPL